MAKRLTKRQLLGVKLASLDDAEVQQVLDYLTVIEALRRPRIAASVRSDDIVELLAEAQENRRARQAFEWEVTRRRAERRGSAMPGHLT
ncbi:MAG TPA: hypothetical protein VEW46_19675 [Pyrinomonadaceae bacterium]|nr:hypothetical protein [Pyrinomonadaceae bacterium]